MLLLRRGYTRLRKNNVLFLKRLSSNKGRSNDHRTLWINKDLVSINSASKIAIVGLTQ